jgi:hypothetical protein
MDLSERVSISKKDFKKFLKTYEGNFDWTSSFYCPLAKYLAHTINGRAVVRFKTAILDIGVVDGGIRSREFKLPKWAQRFSKEVCSNTELTTKDALKILKKV